MSQDSPIRVMSTALSQSSCISFCPSPTDEPEAVSDQIDRLSIIITGMMKDLVHTDAELSDPEELAYLSYYSPKAMNTQNPFHYLSPFISERDEMSVNYSSQALSLNSSVEERQLENEIELRLETEFQIYCRMSMCLEDYRSHELRYISKPCYDTDLSDIEARRESCDSPISFRAYDDNDHTVSCIASILSGRFGIPFKNKTAHDLVNSIESLFYRDVELTIKQISELESMLQSIIDTAEKGQAVKQELNIGQFHFNLNVVEPKGDISIPHKHRLAQNLTHLASEKYSNFTEEKYKLEDYIKQLETEILKLRTEMTVRPQIEDFSIDLSKSMHIAYEEEYRPSKDFISFDLNRTSISTMVTREDIKQHSNIDIEFKTLKSKRDEIDRLKNNIEWQLQELVFLKKECEKREFVTREKERRLDIESQNILYKEREMYDLKDTLAKQKKDYEKLLRQINFERMDLDKERLEFETDKQLFEQSQKVKSMEAMNLKDNISKLLHKKEELKDHMSSVFNILQKQESRPTSRMSTSRVSTSRASTSRASTSSVPFKLSSEISLDELEMLKHEIEHKIHNSKISDQDRNRLGVQLSRIETQIASFKVKRVLEESNQQVHSVSRMSNKLNKSWVGEDSRVLRKSNFQQSLTPQPSKRYRLDNDSNSKENSKSFIYRNIPSELEIGHFYNETSFEKENKYEKLDQKQKQTIKKPLVSGIKLLDLSKVFALENINFKKSVNEEQLIEREEKLKVKENELIERMIKIRCKEIEHKEKEKLLENDKIYLTEARLELLKKEKKWQAAWMKIPDANELIPLVQKGHLTLMKELDNIYKFKKIFDKEKIEISKHWRQVTEGKRLIELQKKELEQSQRDLSNEKRSLFKMKEHFTTILPAIQSMITDE